MTKIIADPRAVAARNGGGKVDPQAARRAQIVKQRAQEWRKAHGLK